LKLSNRKKKNLSGREREERELNVLGVEGEFKRDGSDTIFHRDRWGNMKTLKGVSWTRHGTG